MKSSLLTGLVGLLVGAAVASGLVLALGIGDDDDGDAGSVTDGVDVPIDDAAPPDTSTQTDAARAFIADWQRFRQGTFLVRSTFERTTESGDVLSDESVIVQDPPNRVSVRLGGVVGVIEGHPLSCVQPPGGDRTCTLGDSVSDYDSDVAAELAVIASYFAGESPLYTIDDVGAGCYEVGLTRFVPASPYGTAGRMCFDEETGALVQTRFDKGSVVETTVAVEVTDEIPADAFDYPVG